MVASGNRISMPTAIERTGTEITHTIERNPLPSALTVFGVGVGVGLLAAILVSQAAEEPAPPEPWARRYRRQAMDSMSHVPENVSAVAQQAAKHAVDSVMALLRR